MAIVQTGTTQGNSNNVTQQEVDSTEVALARLETIVESNSERINSGITNAKYPPAPLLGAVGDDATDNTVRLQAIQDYIHTNGGGTLLLPLPSVAYLVKGTITLRKNVKWVFYAPQNATYTDGLCKIHHVPDAPNTDLFVLDAAQAYGYLSGIELENFMISGSANSRYAFNFANPGNLRMSKVLAAGFVDGLVISSAINCRFEHVNLFNMSNSCLRFTGGISTSTSFHNCYFHNSTTPIILEQAKCMGISFDDECVFESCDNGLDIYPGNVVTFNDPYFENIPRTSSAKFIFNLGVSGVDEAVYAKGVCTINGGSIAGFNGAIPAGSGIFNLDRWAALTVSGAKIARAETAIVKTAKSKSTVFVGLYEEQITNTATTVAGVVAVGAGLSNKIFSEYFTVKAASGYMWNILAEFGYTNAELEFTNSSKVGGATTPFRIDAKDNIHLHGAINPGTSEYCSLYPPKAAVVGAIGNNVAEYCYNINSIAAKKLRLGNGLTGIVQTVLIGATAARPVFGHSDWNGFMFFDTTLSKPIWYKEASATKWTDSAGADV